ncbi:MAG: serine/threonine protein kinase, partial [Isosphaeraceae bacterium]
MATGNRDSSTFYEIVLGSGLFNEPQVAELKEKTLSGEWPSRDRELASTLVKADWLSEYQAKRILTGRIDELQMGSYRILDRLGAGSMGRVYKAQHKLMGRVVALKVIAPELTSNERVVKRFLREMRLVAMLDHPNVIKAYESGQVGEQHFIAMEYVQGASLGEMLKKGPLEPVAVIKYAADAALGLDHAHQQGILHRDVKPSNLMLSSDRKMVKVLDLGLGSMMGNDQHQTQITNPGFVLGTIDYMSPEQAQGRESDGRSDLYSLGCCMYHLMTGRVPFQHDNQIQRLALRIHHKPTPIQNYLPNLNSKVVELIDKMLATNPYDRFQTGQELSEALLRLLRKKGQRSSQKSGELQSSHQDADKIDVALESEEEIQPLKPNQPDNARINLGNDLPEARAAMVQPSLPWLAQNAGLAYLI